MKFKNFIMSIWQLPQHIVGLIVKKVSKATPYTTYKDANVYFWNISGGLSLGKYIFVPNHNNINITEKRMQQMIKHEYGHTIQSRYLGWLYLIIIGLPSLIWAGCFQWYRDKTGTSYYDFYTESSADFLGGVER